MDAAHAAPREMTRSDDYPIALFPPQDLEMDRRWGIPFVGPAVRYFLLIPHWVVLAILAVGFMVIACVGWIPILLSGRVPDRQRQWIEELLHRYARVYAYLLLMPGRYPDLGIGVPGPVHVTFNLAGRPINRLWGIPILGFTARFLAALPHLFIVAVLGSCCGLVFMVVWIPILLNGEYPDWALTLYSGTIRYIIRVQAYLMFLPVPYPPFTLD